MGYSTRHLEALRDFPYGDHYLTKGMAFYATDVDADYLVARGKAKPADKPADAHGVIVTAPPPAPVAAADPPPPPAPAAVEPPVAEPASVVTEEQPAPAPAPEPAPAPAEVPAEAATAAPVAAEAVVPASKYRRNRQARAEVATPEQSGESNGAPAEG